MSKYCNGCKRDLENDTFYSYKKSTCKECVNRKVKCDYCDKELNSTNLSKHIKRIHSTSNNSTSITNDSTSINSTSNNSTSKETNKNNSTSNNSTSKKTNKSTIKILLIISCSIKIL